MSEGTELRSFGIKSIKVGDIPSDGTMGTVLAPLGLTYKDSASLKEADPSTTDVFSEEYDTAVESFEEGGQIVLAFSTMDYTNQVLQTCKGGTIVGTAYKAPIRRPVIEKCVQIITKADVIIEIPRLRWRTVINAELKKQGVALLDHKSPILLPKAPGIEPYSIDTYLPPVVEAGAPVNTATASANLVGTSTPFRGTNAQILWSIVSKPVSATPAITTQAALSTAVTGLTVAGDYVFKLAVTDSNDFTSEDTVTVTKTA